MSNGGIKLDNRVAAYIRVQDYSQENGRRLEAQRLGIERWCEQRGYVLFREYREVGVCVHTGGIEKQSELLRLLNDAERGEFDIVVVHTFDRLARKISIQLQALNRLTKAGVGFVCINEQFDDSICRGFLMNQTGRYRQLKSMLK